MARKKKIEAAPMPAPDGTTYITVTGEILQETDAAILISCEGEEYWLPISQIEYVGGKGDGDVAISVPEWLADEKGLYHGMGETPETTLRYQHCPPGHGQQQNAPSPTDPTGWLSDWTPVTEQQGCGLSWWGAQADPELMPFWSPRPRGFVSWPAILSQNWKYFPIL